MKSNLTTNINVDELVPAGVFSDFDEKGTLLLAFGGLLSFYATKPESLMRFAESLQETAVELKARQKMAKIAEDRRKTEEMQARLAQEGNHG